MRISPTLSGLLSDVVFKEEEKEMSPEEASALQEELTQASEQIESDSNDLTIVTKSLNRTFEIVNDMQTALDTNTTDKYTAGLLLSEFASIYKDTLGTEFTYSKNLSDNPLEVRDVLTAGLQASTSFIDTLKNLIKKIWESLKAAAKWFWSKVKQFISWISGLTNKVSKKQTENSFSLLTLEAAKNAYQEHRGKLSDLNNIDEKVKEDIIASFNKELTGLIAKMKIKDNNFSIDDFLKANPTYLSGQNSLNFILNISLISKKTAEMFYEKANNQEVLDSLVTLYFTRSAASLIGAAKIDVLLREANVDNIANIDRLENKILYIAMNPMRELFGKLSSKMATDLVYSIVAGDAGKCIAKDVPELCNNITEMYVDLENLYKAGAPKYEQDSYDISRLNLKSKAYSLTDVSAVDKGEYKIEFANIYVKSYMDQPVKFNIDGYTDFPIDKIMSERENSTGDNKYTKDLEDMGKAFDRALAEADKFVKFFSDVPSTEIKDRTNLMNNLFKMVQNLNAINPTTGIKLFTSVNKAYTTIVEQLDCKAMIEESFRLLNSEK